MTSRISRADVTIRILAINDAYELTNLPRLLTLRKQLIPQPDAFVVAGDFLSPSVLSSIDQGKSIVDVFNAIGVSHVCFGNHEADLPLDIISHRIKESRFQWINTNMPSFPAFSALGQPYYQLSSSSPPSSSLSIPMSMSSIITSKCGKVSLPLIGLMSDEADMFRDGTFKGIEIESTFRHVKKAVEFYTTTNFSLFDDKTHHGNKTNNKEEEEKEGGGGGVYPNCIVPLTHQSMKADRKLSEKCALKNIFLPLIIGGHDHIPMIERHGITQNNPMGTLVVKSGSDAVNAAVIDLHFNSTCRKRYELSHIDVSLSDVNSFRSDLPAKARVARHLSVITDLKFRRP